MGEMMAGEFGEIHPAIPLHAETKTQPAPREVSDPIKTPVEIPDTQNLRVRIESAEGGFESIPLPPKIAELPQLERDLLQPTTLLADFRENWLESGQDPDLLEKVTSEVRVIGRDEFQKSMKKMAEMILDQDGPTLAITSFVGSSGRKIAESDYFAPVREAAESGEILGLLTREDQLEELASKITDETTVVIFDDASLSGAHLYTTIEAVRKINPNVKIKLCMSAVGDQAYERFKEWKIDEIVADYRFPTPKDIFTPDEQELLKDYYGYNIDIDLDSGVYGVFSHKVADNFFRPFNFGAKISEKSGDPLTLLDTHILNKKLYKGGPRTGEVGLFNTTT